MLGLGFSRRIRGLGFMGCGMWMATLNPGMRSLGFREDSEAFFGLLEASTLNSKP